MEQVVLALIEAFLAMHPAMLFVLIGAAFATPILSLVWWLERKERREIQVLRADDARETQSVLHDLADSNKEIASSVRELKDWVK